MADLDRSYRWRKNHVITVSTAGRTATFKLRIWWTIPQSKYMTNSIQRNASFTFECTSSHARMRLHVQSGFLATSGTIRTHRERYREEKWCEAPHWTKLRIQTSRVQCRHAYLHIIRYWQLSSIAWQIDFICKSQFEFYMHRHFRDNVGVKSEISFGDTHMSFRKRDKW